MLSHTAATGKAQNYDTSSNSYQEKPYWDPDPGADRMSLLLAEESGYVLFPTVHLTGCHLTGAQHPPSDNIVFLSSTQQEHRNKSELHQVTQGRFNSILLHYTLSLGPSSFSSTRFTATIQMCRTAGNHYPEYAPESLKSVPPEIQRPEEHSGIITPLVRTRPVVRTIQVWGEESTSLLQHCFECTEWKVFEQGDLEEYSSSVLAYVAFCTETVLTTKTIKVFPNQKPWLDGNVQCETNPTGLNGVVVYDELTYAIGSVSNYYLRNPVSSLVNSTGMDGGLEQQWSLEEERQLNKVVCILHRKSSGVISTTTENLKGQTTKERPKDFKGPLPASSLPFSFSPLSEEIEECEDKSNQIPKEY
ncbi:hypothetical protein F2P81_001042 [Scophthalmus maximus]|uniref:Uncharacterized protein n=1 Tax=Scophthalmus maximus TaxID=52904 RepID=A0A6A4TRA2_SCOMX|nr:hypothetical protein F2P81_001042 [Scophthalmus maximus]